MKKILTIAIALVMVFALASTALAAGWDIVVKEKDVEDIKISIDALSPDLKDVEGYFTAGNKLIAVLEKTYPVVEEDTVVALITVEVPKQDKVSEDMQDYIKNGQLKLKVSSSNVDFSEVHCTNTNADLAATDNECTITFAPSDYDTDWYFIVKGEVAATKKDAKIIATLGVYNEWNAAKEFVWEDASGEDYQVWHDTANKQFKVYADNGHVVFPVVGAAVDADSDSKIDTTRPIKVYLNKTSTYYDVTKQVNNELAFVNGQVYTSGETYDAVKAIFDEIFKALGFTYEGVKYMSEEHFVEYFGTIMETEVSKVWPSGYVVELSTVDPSIVPPQTGDNTSVVGFAMIVVALVAAVVLKKVRA